MKRSGFVQYFQIYPNFRLLGMSGAAYLFDVDDVLQKSDIIEKCSLVDGVTEIHNFIGEHVCIDFAYQDSRDEGRRLELFRRLTNCESPEKFYERVMPPVEISLSNIDWQIIKALRYNAFKPLSTVAKELGLTAKTVRPRFERMAHSNAVIIVPVVNPASIPDTITHVMLLYPSPGRHDDVLKKAMKEFRDSCFHTFTSSPGNAMLCLAARTLAETEDSLIRARKIEGMRDAKLLILKEMREYTQRVDSGIDRKIAETGKLERS
jgi:DNA-binding Lrp family transcriptional regulator